MSLYHHIEQLLFGDAGPPAAYTPQYRLEGRARDPDNQDNLAMRTADPLWMLGRQWQFGEFVGEDNGSAISVQAHYTRRKAVSCSLGPSGKGPKHDIVDIPLEMRVEAVPVNFDTLKQQVRIGRACERMLRLKVEEARQHIHMLRIQFPLTTTGKVDDATVRYLKLMQGRVVNGVDFLIAYQKGELTSMPAEVKEAAEELGHWVRSLLFIPEDGAPSAWQPGKLEHTFQLYSEAEEVTLYADDYQQGHLDWYSFDRAKVRPSEKQLKAQGQIAENMMPVNLSFAGMPDKRLFSFEDRRIDLGDMHIEDTDLIRIMMVDFAMVSGSDWYTFPLEMELGELCWIHEVDVRDVFGVTTTIRNGGKSGREVGPSLATDQDGDGRLTGLDVWDVFKIRNRQVTKYVPKEHFLFLSPAVMYPQESMPHEEVLLLRDEFANMVWAVEKKVQTQRGNTVEGFDLHLELNGPFIPLEAGDQEITPGNPVYRLASNVQANWIPYLPRHVEGQSKEIELQRAYLVSNEPDRMFREIEPLSYLAGRELLTLNEEAIPQSGARVQLTTQRVRWVDGKTYIWRGRKVLAGRGEGNSGLRFDYLEELDNASKM